MFIGSDSQLPLNFKVIFIRIIMKFDSEFPSGWSGTQASVDPSALDRADFAPRRMANTAVILVIDDDPSMSRLIEGMLAGYGEVRKTIEVPVPGELELEGIDLVILDYLMPGRDGLDLLSEIREHDQTVPVLFLTGFGTPELVEEAMRRGANEFLAKPVEAMQLRQAVEKLLGPGESSGSVRLEPHRVNLATCVPDEVAHSRAFSAATSSGRLLHCELIRFSPHSVVVEANDEPTVRTGEPLYEVCFQFGRQHIRSFRAVVGRVSRLSPTRWEFEAQLKGFWSVHEEETEQASGRKPVSEQHSFSLLEEESASRTETRRDLPSAIRLATHELVAFLEEVQDWCAAAESRLAWDSDPLERFREESRFVLETSDRFRGPFWDVIGAFETASEEIVAAGGDLLLSAKRFARRELYPSMLSSPFLARIVERPIGVPGDYGMLGQILSNPLEGYSPYDRVLNSWILASGAADAYRYRIALLEREIRNSVASCLSEKGGPRPARILSMASGVAYEVQHYIRQPESVGEADFTLIDFSEDTLDEARRQFTFHGDLPEGVELRMRQSSVIDLANRSRGLGGGASAPLSLDGYDYTYCAGLYDYLSDRLVSRVSSYLYTTIHPGGLIALSNYTPQNPLKGLMTVVLDWELIYRDVEEFTRIVREALPPEAMIEIETDESGAEVYALARRPR